MSFNIGDLIIGLPNNGYSITDENCVCLVVKIDNFWFFGEFNDVKIQIINFIDKDSNSGIGYGMELYNYYNIQSKRFELFKGKIETENNFKVGDYIKINNNPRKLFKIISDDKENYYDVYDTLIKENTIIFKGKKEKFTLIKNYNLELIKQERKYLLNSFGINPNIETKKAEDIISQWM
jgi:hypothetical protein